MSPFRAHPGRGPGLSSESPELRPGLKPGDVPKCGAGPNCIIVGNEEHGSWGQMSGSQKPMEETLVGQSGPKFPLKEG